MAQPPPGPEHTVATHHPPPASPSDLDQARRTSMAAERTWLAWWRTALAASAGALAIGRFAPELLHVAAWPYVALGCGYASLAVALWLVGAQRQRELEHALRTDSQLPLRFRTVGLFTVGGRWPRDSRLIARFRTGESCSSSSSPLRAWLLFGPPSRSPRWRRASRYPSPNGVCHQ